MRFISLFAASLTLGFLSPRQFDETLDIDPIQQETPVWCWAAVGEMIFRYYDIPNINPANDYQCGVVALLHPLCSNNCGNCVVGAGSMYTVRDMIMRYPVIAGQLTGIPVGHLSASYSGTSLSPARIKSEIDEGRPVVIGISPAGFPIPGGPSQHVALVVGYEGDGDDFKLVINDPYPYDADIFSGKQNPYIVAGGDEAEAGQYTIGFNDLRTKLRWRETIYRIRCSGSACP